MDRAPALNIPKRQPMPNLLWNASGTHASGREPPTLRPMAEEEEEEGRDYEEEEIA